ncbi:alpha/beta hydrolase [Emcibacter sp. SYSU 3D8]|uniref:alpha/beta fold hydrolase n=1 Tax=Emcibacter sp. SYSU 3D8 TaxID=3133969 RepID=UPI0031FEBFBC
MFFPGFERRRIATDGAEINLVTGGSGPPVLLLHGYPQTHVMWHQVAPVLAENFTVVVPDLRGYGDSSKPPAGELTYAKRTMAMDNVQVMRALGFETWCVAGHDRGARVSYRMAFDHPDRVEKLCILDVVPTIEQYDAAGKNRKVAVGMYHWFFLASPAPLPERLIGGDPEYYLRHSMETWSGQDARFDPAAMAEYIRCFSDPETIRATCDCYRAGPTVDCDIDEATRKAGEKISCPTLILWGDRDGKWDEDRMLGTWKRWASDVRGQAVPGGHFCPEEAPDETAKAIGEFFAN